MIAHQHPWPYSYPYNHRTLSNEKVLGINEKNA